MRIVRRNSQVKYGDSDMEIEMAGRKTELAAYLETQYFINLRRPRTENELRALIYQLEALSHHFDELTYPLRKLRPKTNITSGGQEEDGDLRKEVWSKDQEAVFEELKDTIRHH